MLILPNMSLLFLSPKQKLISLNLKILNLLDLLANLFWKNKLLQHWIFTIAASPIDYDYIVGLFEAWVASHLHYHLLDVNLMCTIRYTSKIIKSPRIILFTIANTWNPGLVSWGALFWNVSSLDSCFENVIQKSKLHGAESHLEHFWSIQTTIFNL